MELIIKSVNVTEQTEIVKSISWLYGDVSGTKEISEPDFKNFIELDNLTNDIVKGWLINLIDFKQYDNVVKNEPFTENIISVELYK